jgi:membrane-associated protease RseP (regulator of RpoE activity)
MGARSVVSQVASFWLLLSLAESVLAVESAGERKFAGLDVQFDKSAAAWKVIQVWDGSPAHRAGIQAGDLLVSVNGKRLNPPNDISLNVDKAAQCGVSSSEYSPVFASPYPLPILKTRSVDLVLSRNGVDYTKSLEPQRWTRFAKGMGHGIPESIKGDPKVTKCKCMGCYECEEIEDGIVFCICTCWACWDTGIHGGIVAVF